MTRHRLNFATRAGISVGIIFGAIMGAPAGYFVGGATLLLAMGILMYRAYQNGDLAE